MENIVNFFMVSGFVSYCRFVMMCVFVELRTPFRTEKNECSCCWPVLYGEMATRLAGKRYKKEKLYLYILEI